MRGKLIPLLFLLAALAGACAPQAHMGVQDRALMAPPEFAQTEAAIAQAERSPGAKQCPDKIAKAKELAKQGIETYWACRTEDALKMLAEARRLAKEAEGCQPPPAPAPKPTPPPPPAPPKKEISFKWVYFDFDKFVLTPQARGILDETARILQANPEVKLELAGHTDGRGTDGYNRRLSEKRSKAVYDYLITRGIAPGRLKPTAFGEANPVASNETEEGRAKNRRVELKILR